MSSPLEEIIDCGVRPRERWPIYQILIDIQATKSRRFGAQALSAGRCKIAVCAPVTLSGASNFKACRRPFTSFPIWVRELELHQPPWIQGAQSPGLRWFHKAHQLQSPNRHPDEAKIRTPFRTPPHTSCARGWITMARLDTKASGSDQDGESHTHGGRSNEIALVASPTETTPALEPTSSAQESPFYKVYKRRFFGLGQLVLLNIIVSWDVRDFPLSSVYCTGLILP